MVAFNDCAAVMSRWCQPTHAARHRSSTTGKLWERRIGADYVGAVGANASREKVLWRRRTQKNVELPYKFNHCYVSFKAFDKLLFDI